jgi:hypothetical protein
MALTQDEADEFMAAQKSVPAGGAMDWQQRSPWASCRFPVEVSAAQVGELILITSIEIPEKWSFVLTFRGDEVYLLHVRPIGNHRNPENRPAGFPRKVPEKVHAHIYVEGSGMTCAKPAADQGISNHQEMLSRFCDLAHLAFGPEYRSPPVVRPRLG